MAQFRTALAIAFLIGSAWVGQVAAQTAPAASSQARYASNAPSIADLRKSIVRVVGVDPDGYFSFGSGVVVGTGGPDAPTYRYIATNAHVIQAIREGKHTLAIVAEGTHKPIPVRIADAQNPFDFDLVFLETDGIKADPIPIASDIPQTGDPVRVLGFPGAVDTSLSTTADEPTLGAGIVSTVKLDNWSTSGGPPFEIVQHTAPINPGNSGGALLDDCGALIGINTQDSGHETVSAQGARINIPAAPGIYFALSGVEVLRLAKHGGISPNAVSGKCVSGAAPAAVPPTVAPPISTTTGGSTTTTMDTGHSGPPVLLFVILAAAVALILAVVALVFLKPGKGSGPHRTGMPAPGPTPALSAPSVLKLMGSDGTGGAVRLRVEASTLASRPDGVLIGRSPPPGGLVVEDARPKPLVSREHAHILMRDGGFQVRDAESTNGTFLNGEKLTPGQPRPLRSGDRLRLGDLDFAVDLS